MCAHMTTDTEYKLKSMAKKKEARADALRLQQSKIYAKLKRPTIINNMLMS